jgi:hypothetical protein
MPVSSCNAARVAVSKASNSYFLVVVLVSPAISAHDSLDTMPPVLPSRLLAVFLTATVVMKKLLDQYFAVGLALKFSVDPY